MAPAVLRNTPRLGEAPLGIRARRVDRPFAVGKGTASRRLLSGEHAEHREDGLTEIEKNLPTLAERVNTEHRACEQAVNSALTHAINAGELLVQAKAEVPHGSWGTWLAENFEGSDRTARAYMRVYNNRGEIEAKRQSSANMSLDGALKALSSPKEATQPERSNTLEELEAWAEDSLSQARSAALGIAENLDAIRRGRGWVHLGYTSFADYFTGEFATRVSPFPIPYEVVSDEAGEPLPVFAMAESIHAWGVARMVEPLLREPEE
jgi:hypothetical protein